MTIKNFSQESLIPAEKCGAVKAVAFPAFTRPPHVVERQGDAEESPSGFRRTRSTPQQPITEPAAEAASLTLEQQLQQAKEQAYVEGFAEGKKAGYDEGFLLGRADGEREGASEGLARAEEEARQRFEAQLARQGSLLRELSRQLVSPVAEQDEAITRALAEMSLSIAREVIQRELATDSSQMEAICREAILLLPLESGTVRLYIHPQDQPIAKKLSEELEGSWQIIPDSQMLPGGCRIETQNSLVDVSVENKLRLIAQQVAEQHLHTHAQTNQQEQEALDQVEQTLEQTAQPVATAGAPESGVEQADNDDAEGSEP
ncbi:flagellar assembly protein FliH [Aestuariirhabdus litorea]|uniref:Flagellar assembly protein FliH n=1 Tax=Aestuariirhabdus litorea TaxID=2528527 RepID=A0A3P3VW96_9GAMM|nr:flagellar assembly protein FliH [Aestuariirhabdus litorea]RRJ84993.1 flagellar assembly protein FliH [Aestuariirhabdus litorea]RWW98218.1 flagellar assembly protein FliH [Endozoicomonadaceae bacterium GTF-13]